MEPNEIKGGPDDQTLKTDDSKHFDDEANVKSENPVDNQESEKKNKKEKKKKHHKHHHHHKNKSEVEQKRVESPKLQNSETENKEIPEPPKVPAKKTEEDDDNNFPMPIYDDILQTDRYGFEINPNEQLSELELLLRKQESDKESERVNKWLEMFKDWKTYCTTKKKKLKERFKKGVPDTWRARAWQYIIDPDCRLPAKCADRPDIQIYIDRGRLECVQTIDVDLSRTMPNVAMFKDKKTLISLRRILIAYSNIDSELGYTQGMGFYAAVLLLYMDEVAAFWCFKNLMMDERFGLRYYFMKGFPRLYECFKIWDLLLMKRYKKVARHFDAIGLQGMIYTISWFLCSFQNIGFPPVLRLLIFDRWVIYRTRAILSFALTIIDLNQEFLLANEMEIVLPALQGPEKSPGMGDWRLIMKTWDKNWIGESEYRNLFPAAKVEYFP